MRIIFFCSIYVYIILNIACQKDFSTSSTSIISLSAKAVECTEVWLNLSIDEEDNKTTFTVKRDTHLVYCGKIPGTDTLLHDFNLEPDRDYFYEVTIAGNQHKTGYATLNITTMDTTHQEYSKEIYSIGGEKGSSVFFDVAINANDDIWAVGIIYTEEVYTWDSLGNWIEPYNAAHWNGNDWILKRIPFIRCGSDDIYYPAIQAVNFFSQDTAIFVNGGKITKKYDTNYFFDCTMNEKLQGAMEHIWGLDQRNYYIVGSKSASGTDNIFLNYNSNRWVFMDVPTSIDINDIWGIKDNTSEVPFILIPLSFKYQTGEKSLLQFKGQNTFEEINWPFYDSQIHSVWFKDKKRIFVCGGGVYTRRLNGKWEKYSALPSVYMNKIRGNDINDLFVAGDFGLLAHYNGNTWKQFTEFNEVSKFNSVAVSDKKVVAVGQNNPSAVIYTLIK